MTRNERVRADLIICINCVREDAENIRDWTDESEFSIEEYVQDIIDDCDQIHRMLAKNLTLPEFTALQRREYDERRGNE